MSSRNLSYRDLHNMEIKKLVSILRDYQQVSDPKTSKAYWNDVKESIRALPHHLRSSSLTTFTNPENKDGKVKTGKLCSGHSGLNSQLIHSVWSTLRFEFEHGVGRFLYPLIMHAGLRANQEWNLRQLEPVLEMFLDDFDIADHTPPGRDFICPVTYENDKRVSKWHRQENECPACQLARIGSDKVVLSALLACIVGRFSSRNVGRKSDVKSNRVRFVRYWLKKMPNGDKLADEAWDHGEELRRLHKAWKAHQNNTPGNGFYGKHGQSGTDAASSIAPSSRSSGIKVDISGDFHPGFKSTADKARQSTVSDINVDISDPYTQFKRPESPTTDLADHANYQFKIPRKPVPQPRAQNVRRSEAPSVYSTDQTVRSSGISWESDISTVRPFSQASAVPQPLRSSKNSKTDAPKPGRLTTILDSPKRDRFPSNYGIPHPNRRSIYGGFGREANDDHMYDGYDVSPPSSPVTETSGAGHRDVSPPTTPLASSADQSAKKGRRDTAATTETHWSDFFVHR